MTRVPFTAVTGSMNNAQSFLAANLGPRDLRLSFSCPLPTGPDHEPQQAQQVSEEGERCSENVG